MNRSALLILLFATCTNVSAAEPEVSGHWSFQPLWGDEKFEISFNSESQEHVIQHGHVGEIVDSCADETYSLCFMSGSLVIAIPRSEVGKGDMWSRFTTEFVVRAAGLDLKILGKEIKGVYVIDATWLLNEQYGVPDRHFEILYSNEEGLIGFAEFSEVSRGWFWLSSDENPLGGTR